MKIPIPHFATAGLAALFLSSAAYGAPIFSDDFQGDTPGDPPSAFDTIKYSNANGGHIQVTDSGTTPSDPFGPGDNQSLYLSRDTTATKGPVAQFSLPGSLLLSSGTLTFDLYTLPSSTGNTGILEIDLGVLGNKDSERTNSLAAIEIHTGNDQQLRYFSGSTDGGDIKSTNSSVPSLTKNTVSISWDASEQTYSILLNGAVVYDSDGTTTAFGFANPAIAGVSQIRFTTTGTKDIAYFIDNVSVTAIPEPATAALLGIGAFALLNGLRRRGPGHCFR